MLYFNKYKEFERTKENILVDFANLHTSTDIQTLFYSKQKHKIENTREKIRVMHEALFHFKEKKDT